MPRDLGNQLDGKATFNAAPLPTSRPSRFLFSFRKTLLITGGEDQGPDGG
ncbi:MAG TPA: hypothetical protein VFV58_29100 [Blastocatellia bacterium]|nr:hypothetical protein [Blastocatellia bacterium]